MAGGDALQIQGDDKSVALRGTVDSDAIRQQKGTDMQAFFGPAVAVNNQLLVKASEPVAVITPPPTAKLFAAGVDVMRVKFRKPENADESGDLAEARRVEVSVE